MRTTRPPFALLLGTALGTALGACGGQTDPTGPTPVFPSEGGAGGGEVGGSGGRPRAAEGGRGGSAAGGTAGGGSAAGGSGGQAGQTAPVQGGGGRAGAGGSMATGGSGGRAPSMPDPNVPPPKDAPRNAYGNVCAAQRVRWEVKKYTPDELTLSHRHGFYEQPIQVELKSPFKNIRYTTDGTKPSPTAGQTYAGPIKVETTTTLRVLAFDDPMKATRVYTQTYIFPKDVQRQPNKAPAGAFWDTVVDPRIAQTGETGAKFVDALKSVPTISITMDPKDLFGPGGIHAGENLKNGDLEKEGSFEYIDPADPQGGVSVNAIFKIQGGGGRWFKGNFDPKQSFSVKFRGSVGPGKLEFPLLKTAPDGACAPAVFDRIVLRDGHNESFPNPCCTRRDYITLLRDQFSRSTQIAMTPDSAGPHGTFTHVYLNGLYWGLYNPTERPAAEGMPFYYGGHKDDWSTYKGKDGKITNGDLPPTVKTPHKLWDDAGLLADKARTDPAAYAELKKVLDTKSFADWMLIILGSGIADIQWYATYTVPQPTMMTPVNPIRFWVWDGEDSFRDPAYASGSRRGFAGYAWELGGVGEDSRSLRTSLWEKLQRSAEFKVELADRIFLHLTNGGAMTDEKMLERWRGLVKQIELAVIGDLARWGDSQGSTTTVNHNAPLVSWNDWKTKAVPHVEANLKGNAGRMFEDLKRRGFYPPIDPPKSSLPTGNLKGPATLSLTNPNGKGTIYFTLDGSDPRKLGGDTGATAKPFQAPLAVSPGTETAVLARVRDGNTWSALTEIKLW